MSRSADSRENKVNCVTAWLERNHNATVVRVRGCVVIIHADIVEVEDGGESVGQDVRVDTFTATEKEVERWFDAAAKRMLAEGLCQDDALAETWPTKDDDGAVDRQREPEEESVS